MKSPNKMMGSISNAITGGNTKLFGGFGSTGLPAQQMTNVPPAPSNTLGQAQPVFNQQTQQNAQGMFGTQQTMQDSVGATPMFKKKCNKKY